MVLILHPPPSSSSFTPFKPSLLLHAPPSLKATKILVKCQQDLPTQETNSGSKKNPSSSSTGLGFGSSAPAPAPAKKSQPKGKKRERDDVLRRAPFEKPSFATPEEAARAKERRRNENAFLITWFGLGAIIILQGIALAASGFLPEEWDNFFVKYLYPSFTPTVFLFVGGTVVYGVLKYLQNENPNSEN